jgi:hypothetical protein
MQALVERELLCSVRALLQSRICIQCVMLSMYTSVATALFCAQGVLLTLRIDIVIPGGQMAMPGEGAAAAAKAAPVDVTLIDPRASEYRLEA